MLALFTKQPTLSSVFSALNRSLILLVSAIRLQSLKCESHYAILGSAVIECRNRITAMTVELCTAP